MVSAEQDSLPLPDPILGKLWPASRVLVGCRTSRRIRHILLLHAERVLFKSAISDDADRRERKKKRQPKHFPGICTFSGFCSDNVQVEIVAEGCSRASIPILWGWEAAVNAGWRGSVSHLRLRSCGLGDSTSTVTTCWSDTLCTDSIAVKALHSVLVHNRTMHVLDLGFNYLDDPWAEEFAGIPFKGESLTHLSLAGNGLTDAGIFYLRCWLGTLERLTHLDLSSNDISSRGASVLAERLCNCRGLTSLDLRGNGISSEGANALSATLRRCTALASLDLGMNALADFSNAVNFCGMLAQSTSLTFLNLEENNIGDAGADTLSSCWTAGSCPNLALLDLGSNSIRSANFAQALKGHTALAWLGLSSNNLGWEAVADLCCSLADCPRLKMLNLDNNFGSGHDLRADEERLMGMLPCAVRASRRSGEWLKLRTRMQAFPLA